MKTSTASYHKYKHWILGKLKGDRGAAKGQVNAHVIEYYIEGRRLARPPIATPEERRASRKASSLAWIARNPEKHRANNRRRKMKDEVRIKERDRKRAMRAAAKPAKDAAKEVAQQARMAAQAAETHRTCNRCDALKAIEEFEFSKPLYRRRHCKTCGAKMNKANYDANPEMHRQRAKDYRNRSPEIAERQREHCRRYGKQNREAINARRRARIARNPEEKIVKSLRDRLHDLVKLGQGTKVQRTKDLYGCTVEELRIHLESLFKPDMTWSQYGFHGFHIDHVIPCNAYDMNDLEEQRRCFNWRNLRPEWRFENQSNGNRVDMELVKQHNIEDLLPKTLKQPPVEQTAPSQTVRA